MATTTTSLLPTNDVKEGAVAVADKSQSSDGSVSSTSVTETTSRPVDNKDDWNQGSPGTYSVSSTKAARDSKTGLRVKEVNGQVYIKNIGEDSPFHGTKLCKGHRIVSINSVPCSTFDDVRNTTASAYPTVTITATSLPPTPRTRAPVRTKAPARKTTAPAKSAADPGNVRLGAEPNEAVATCNALICIWNVFAIVSWFC